MKNTKKTNPDVIDVVAETLQVAEVVAETTEATPKAKTTQSKTKKTPETENATPKEAVTSNLFKTMENTAKSAFDFLFEAQSKFVDTLADNAKKITETLNATETIEKARTFVTEFLEKQQANLETMTENIKKQAGFEKTPEALQDVVKAQQDFGKEWFEALRNTVKAKDLKELNEILMSNVEKLQENVKNLATYAIENVGKPVNFAEMFTTDYAKDLTKKWLDMWKPVVK
ncbi:MAG: hypothetical protein EAZ95_15570 [Bacteroidetes bacterium]|jgi:hypothetical protein|nr:MAG: hypothetical protein EAZ95_15570 [Bacteroidota bacterium]